MIKHKLTLGLTLVLAIFLSSCKDDDTSTTTADTLASSELHAAFAEFADDMMITVSDGRVTIETDGLPNHQSPYWSNTTERTATDPRGMTLVTRAAAENHPLFVEPTTTSHEEMAPGNIDDFNGSFTLTVPTNPSKASSTSATGLGPIGLAVSGSVIYNDEEGANVPLEDAAGSLDFNGAHTGPQSYHYHLEPKSFSDDDDALIGIISDGFFIYGKKCRSTGTYPTDLDASGGHTTTTQYSDEPEYHYHCQSEPYLGNYYILFPGDYQGTPNEIR